MNSNLTQLHRFIVEHYSLEEFRTLCFELGVRFDSLGGTAIAGKAEELVQNLGRLRRYEDLLLKLSQDRPVTFDAHGMEAMNASDLYAQLGAMDKTIVTGDSQIYPFLPIVPKPQHSAWQIALRTLTILSWIVAAVWYLADPGFEPLLAFLTGVTSLLLFFVVPEGKSEDVTAETIGRNQRLNRTLVEKVRVVWIRGVLEKNLHEEACIELGLAEKPSAVTRPWTLALEQPGEETRPLPADTKIEDIFRELGGALLILGEPGSGKTITLLELAKVLLAEARVDPLRPVPLVFNLSLWGYRRLPLIEWLVEELDIMYGIGRRFAPSWLAAANYTLLLDGLDEVAAEHRDACVEAINNFHHEYGLTHIVVCSRTGDYEALTERLHLMGAVVIQPLTRVQVDAYLAAGGEELAVARTAVAADSLLRELASKPLTLNIIALAYKGKSLAELASGTLNERRQQLFAAYVERMFNRRSFNPRYDKRQSIVWISWLARQMHQRTMSVFYIEQLQSDWLMTLRKKRLYRLCVGLVVGLVYWFAFGLYSELVDRLYGGLNGKVYFGPVGGLVFGLIFWLHNDLGKIELVERLHWSWKKGVKYLFSGNMLFKLFVGIFMGLVVGIVGGFAGGLVSGSLIFLYAEFVRSLTYTESETKISPNQGIRRSIFNAARAGLSIGLYAGLCFGLGFGLGLGIVSGLLVGLVVCLLGILFGGLRYGGETALKHVVLRILIYWYKYLPLRLVGFLDEMTSLIILRKVGGGYMFTHRMLLEYFVGLETEKGVGG